MSGINRVHGNELDRWSNTVDTVWKEVQTEKAKKHEGLGLEGGNFDGAKVGIKQSQVKDGVDGLREGSKERLGKGPGMGAKALNVIGSILLAVPVGVAQLAKSIVGTVVGLVGGLIFKGVDKLIGEDKRLNQVQEHARQALGSTPMENSILNKDVQIKGENGEMRELSMNDALEELRQKLGGDDRLSNREMMQYVRMGERIVQSLSDTQSPPPPTTLNVKGVDGETYTVKPGLEVTRAISWYLQAKGISDNSGFQGAFLKEGAMIAKDPDNKLFDFLRSSNETYGRVSSHMKNRSDSVSMNPLNNAFNAGFFTMAESAKSGNPLQYGIEDFGNRMPSKGGSLLFDKLKNDEIYLKWEGVGMPNSVSLSGNDSHTVGDGLWNRGLAFFRCLGHTCSFIGNKDPGGYRGEKFEKGEGKELLNGFKDVVNSMKHIDKDTKETLIGQVKKHGATEMNRALEMLLNVDGGEVTPEEKDALQYLKTRLDDWMGGMGPDLGIERKGNEIHLTLPPSRQEVLV
jgi:hypothetical protein